MRAIAISITNRLFRACIVLSSVDAIIVQFFVIFWRQVKEGIEVVWKKQIMNSSSDQNVWKCLGN